MLTRFYDFIHPEIISHVISLRENGIPTTLSGDMYGTKVFYIDLQSDFSNAINPQKLPANLRLTHKFNVSRILCNMGYEDPFHENLSDDQLLDLMWYCHSEKPDDRKRRIINHQLPGYRKDLGNRSSLVFINDAHLSVSPESLVSILKSSLNTNYTPRNLPSMGKWLSLQRTIYLRSPFLHKLLFEIGYKYKDDSEYIKGIEKLILLYRDLKRAQ